MQGYYNLKDVTSCFCKYEENAYKKEAFFELKPDLINCNLKYKIAQL
jgi:hypothetical protein